MAEVMPAGAGGAGAARLSLATQGHAPLCCRSQHEAQGLHGAGVLQADRHPRPGSSALPRLPGCGRVPGYGSCSALLSPLLLPLPGTATARHHGSGPWAQPGPALPPSCRAPECSAEPARRHELSAEPPFPSSQGLPGLPLLLLQAAPEAGAAAAGVRRAGGLSAGGGRGQLSPVGP